MGLIGKAARLLWGAAKTQPTPIVSDNQKEPPMAIKNKPAAVVVAPMTPAQKAVATKKAKAEALAAVATAKAKKSAKAAADDAVEADEVPEEEVAVAAPKKVKLNVGKATEAKPAPAKATKAATAKVDTDDADDTEDSADESDEVGRKELAVTVRDKMVEKGFGVSEKLAVNLIAAFEAAVSEVMAGGKSVNLPGFGKFKTTMREARVGRNPHSEEPLDIPASLQVSFKVGKAFKVAVQSSMAEA